MTIKISKKRYERLKQDIEDMQDSRCTIFIRCIKCFRLHDKTCICPYCLTDNSSKDKER